MLTVYDEATLKAYMAADLGPMATMLGWTVEGGDYDEIYVSTLLRLGVEDLSGLTGLDNLRKVRAFASVEAWRAVIKALAGRYDFSADGASLSRSQAQVQAAESLSLAEDEAMSYGDWNVATMTSVVHKHDPHTYLEEEDRTL